MHYVHLIGTIIYFTMLIGLSCYGLHRYWMLYLYYKHRKETPTPMGRLDPLPKVTVQLPLYNEMYVVERLIDAVVALDYPKDKLQVQVLDDSNDETADIVNRKVTELRAEGFDIAAVRRLDRTGYKAGALQNGLLMATGEFIAIFDADFVPQPSFLKRTIQFFSDPKVGMVQTRWGHLNGNDSLLTRLQSMFVDGHFIIEQSARARSGRFMNFNGSAGIWRRLAIESGGGWHADTLAEDLDLSYRAQLKGWRFLFLPEVVTPGELPPDMNAFKTQQHRWAKGSIQASKKLLPRLWRSHLPLKVKLEGTIHLVSYFNHFLLLLLCVTLYSSVSATTAGVFGLHSPVKFLLVDVPLFFAGTVSVVAFYMCAQRELKGSWWKCLLYVPALMAVGIGLSVNNARAVLEALFNHKSEFVRTPKYGDSRREKTILPGKYFALRGLVPYVELGFGVYFSYLLFQAMNRNQWSMIPFVLIFQVGFLYVGLMSVAQTSFQLFRQTHQTALSAAGA